MAGNHNKPRRVRKLIRKLKATPLMRAQGVQVVAHPEIRERNLDEFPGGVFSAKHWTAKECSSAQEVRSALDSFKLVGRRIWSLHTSSHDYVYSVENLLSAAGRCIDGEDECSRRTICAYAYLPKRTIIERRMEIDEPFVIEFKDGDTFEIDVPMDPLFLMSMNRIPLEVADNRGLGVDPFYMFSDVIGKTIAAVDVESSTVRRLPYSSYDLDEPREIATAIYLRFENGSRLKFAPFIDFLAIESQNRCGMVKRVSWETVRSGFVKHADVCFDRRSGFVAKGTSLMFGWKGGRYAGDHCVVLAPGPGWHRYIASGREAFLDADDAAMLALAVGIAVPRYWQDHRVDLSYDEWRSVLSALESILSSSVAAHAPNSALMRNMCAVALQRNAEKKKSQREDEFKLTKRAIYGNMELLDDLNGWTRRALDQNTVLRIIGL